MKKVMNLLYCKKQDKTTKKFISYRNQIEEFKS